MYFQSKFPVTLNDVLDISLTDTDASFSSDSEFELGDFPHPRKRPKKEIQELVATYGESSPFQMFQNNPNADGVRQSR